MLRFERLVRLLLLLLLGSAGERSGNELVDDFSDVVVSVSLETFAASFRVLNAEGEQVAVDLPIR